MTKQYVNVRIEKKLYEKIINANVPRYLYFFSWDDKKIEINWSYVEKVTPKIETILEFWINNSELYFKTLFFTQCLKYQNIKTLLDCKHLSLLECKKCFIKYCEYCEIWKHSILGKCLSDEKIEKHEYSDNIFTKLSYKLYAK